MDQNYPFESIEKLCRSLNKKNETSVKNIGSIPVKATIRLEYVRCGKGCKKCPEKYDCNYNYHSPYFYAYWRDENNNRKLKKKYIGELNSDLEKRIDLKGKRIGVWNPLSVTALRLRS
jgi:hypothetical protein